MIRVDSDDTEENPFSGIWLEGDSLAPPCQADRDIVDEIVQFARPHMKPSSVVYDLGCGDGRICIAATKATSCRSFGCEIELELHKAFTESIKREALTERVTAIHGDLRDVDITRADVVIIYLLPESIEMIKSKLLDMLRNGGVLICNTWGPKGLKCIDRRVCGPLNNVTLLKFDKSSLGDSDNGNDCSDSTGKV